MTRTRFAIAVLIALTCAADAPAQFFGPPVIGLPVVSQSGIDFRVGGRHLRIHGFLPLGDPYTLIVPATPTPFGYRQVGPAFLPYGPYSAYPFGPYGAIDQRITVQLIAPAVAVRPRLSLAQGPERYDLSGIDLDVEPASKIWGDKPGLAKNAPPRNAEVARPAPPRNAEVARPAPPPERKPEEVAANQVKPPAPPVPRPVLDGNRFLELGVAAFRNGDYGLALLRFRQAEESKPPAPRALFYQTHAYIAIGKYREAAEALQQTLDRQPILFPNLAFSPKRELYDNDENAWSAHFKRLEEAQRQDAKDANILLLLGYLAWFDGQRDAAVDYFRQSRALAADPRWCDLFLIFAKK